MKRWTKAVAGGLVLCLLMQVLGFAGSSAGIRERVVRLHVLAHDDSDAEQALKLKVRDTVLAAVSVQYRKGTVYRDKVAVLADEVSLTADAYRRCLNK